MLVHHCNPVEESFIAWMSGCPETYHQLDMQRFYVFVRTVHAHHVKRWRDYAFFEAKVQEACPTFSKEKIQSFYERMLNGLDLLKARSLPSYVEDINIDAKGTAERRVIHGKIVERIVEK